MGWKIVSLIVSIALVSNLVSSNSEFDLESENSEKAKRCKRGWEPFEDISTLLKRQENGTATTPGVDSCNLNQDCFACNEDPKGCLWCGGGGCGKTRIGCYSKVNVEQFGMCSHPEDQKMDNVTLCKDDCAQNNDCLLCTSDKRKSCGWCRDSGSCRRGKSTGPSIIKTSCSSWRWNNGEEFEGTCALSYQNCTTATSCNACHFTWQSLSTSCTWCADSKIPLTSSGGGGYCTATMQKMACSPVKVEHCPVLLKEKYTSKSDGIVLYFSSTMMIALLLSFLLY